MIIEQEWTVKKLGKYYCRACHELANAHTKRGFWITNKGQVVGGTEYMECAPKKCRVPCYLRLWDDQATYERAKAKVDAPEFAGYGKIEAEAIPGLDMEIPTFSDTPAPEAQETPLRAPQTDLWPQVSSPEFLHSLTAHRLKELSKRIAEERRLRYPQKNERKYGNIQKGFTTEELRRFLEACKNPTAKTIFTLQAFCGLRITEACSLKADQIDLTNQKLYVHTLKARTGDSIYLHEKVCAQLREWVAANEERIKKSGYLFPASEPLNLHPYISPHFARKTFRDTVAASGLDACYATSTERKKGRVPRRLHRLTTHSLRHYFITAMYQASKDPLLTQRLARHRDAKNTQGYIFLAGHDMDDTVKRAFDKI